MFGFLYELTIINYYDRGMFTSIINYCSVNYKNSFKKVFAKFETLVISDGHYYDLIKYTFLVYNAGIWKHDLVNWKKTSGSLWGDIILYMGWFCCLCTEHVTFSWTYLAGMTFIINNVTSAVQSAFIHVSRNSAALK